MHLPTIISAALNHLAEASDQDPSSLHEPFTALLEDLGTAVSSVLGLRLSLPTDGPAMVLDSWSDTARSDDVATSIHLPASALLHPGTGGGFTFWAGRPGAFVDLATDLTYSLRLAAGTIRLDEHLTGITTTTGVVGLVEASVINRAVGVLIERGQVPSDARSELERQARDRGHSVLDEAQLILRQQSADPL